MAKERVDKTDVIAKENTCGIIMPISEHPDYPQGHWGDVLEILKQAVSLTEFNAELVSNDGVVGLIQDRIVTNIFYNEIVICDVSSKNPNVMFELGMRLAFDKPTIIIKDDKTGYSFDIGGIEHISYPSSLRFADIIDFKTDLANRIKATYKRAKDDPKYSPFLKSFGRTIKPSVITQTEIPENLYISDQISDLKRMIYSLVNSKRDSENQRFAPAPKYYHPDKDRLNQIVEDISFKFRELNEDELYKKISRELAVMGIKASESHLYSLIKMNKKLFADTLFD